MVKDGDISSSSGVVAINVLDSPAVSQIDLDISNMGANKKQKKVSNLVASSHFMMLEFSTIPRSSFGNKAVDEEPRAL